MADHGIPTDNAEVIGDIYAAWAAWTPHALAVTSASAYGGKKTLTYAELDTLTTTVAANLVRRGIQRGQRVAFLTSNNSGIEGVLTYAGTHKAAAVALPINGRLTPAEVVPLAVHAEISALVVEGAFIEHALAVLDQLDDPPLIFVAANEIPEGTLDFRVLLEPIEGLTAADLPKVEPSDIRQLRRSRAHTVAVPGHSARRHPAQPLPLLHQFGCAHLPVHHSSRGRSLRDLSERRGRSVDA